MTTDLIGWLAATLLLLTMGTQVKKQWTSGAVAGVSKGLFAGQLAASLLFTTYSVMKSDTVFIAVNSFMVLNALAGLWIDQRNRRMKTFASQP